MPADPRFEIDLGRVLQAIETASPSSAVQVLAAQLGQQFGAEQVSFLIADFSGHSLVRITQSRTEDPRQEAAQVPVQLGGDSPYARAMTGQRVQVEPEGDGARLLVPVTARGEAIGLLELVLPAAPSDDMTGALAVAGHAMAYVVTSERRHTDLYEWGQRSRPLTLAAEIQHRLLPDAFTCEGGVFTLAAWLEPASDIGGDTFDYSVDPDRLFLSMTDAMGHETDQRCWPR